MPDPTPSPVPTPTPAPIPTVSPFDSTDLPLILIFEGGFTDNINDHGGRTNKGITQRNYDDYRQKKGLSLADVKNISDSEVHEIYLNGYWLPSKCSQMPPKVSTVVFDSSVNCGQARSIMTVQKAIGAKVDGIIGSETLSKIKGLDPTILANSFLDNKVVFYKALVQQDATQQLFLSGWLRRVQFLRDFVNGVKTLGQIKASW